jgi:type IV pilus assembly protein PilV
MNRMNSAAATLPGRMQNGFTLIEVLVALLILAIGLLGVAALQFRGLQYNHDAYMRSQANVLAYDIADRMRLNAANAAAYIMTYAVALPSTAGVCDETLATAANDLDCWRRAIDRAFPPAPPGGNSAEIAAAPGLVDTYTVTLRWWDRENNAHSINYTFRLQAP